MSRMYTREDFWVTGQGKLMALGMMPEGVRVVRAGNWDTRIYRFFPGGRGLICLLAITRGDSKRDWSLDVDSLTGGEMKC